MGSIETNQATSTALSISVTVNGKPVSIEVGSRVVALLEQLEFKSSAIAVERNLEILPREKFAECTLLDGDQLEIVSLVGGG